MSYADTTSVTVTTAWTSIGSSPLRFTNNTPALMQVFRQASGTPAASAAGVDLDRGVSYSNATTGEVIYARLMPGTGAASAAIVVDQWT